MVLIAIKHLTHHPHHTIPTESPMKIKDRNKVANRISDRFGDRITLVGEYYGMKQKMLFYCHDCHEWFYQVVASLIAPEKMHSTRCKCDSGPWTRKGDFALAEWDCYDRIRPTRGQMDMYDPSKKKNVPRWRLDQM